MLETSGNREEAQGTGTSIGPSSGTGAGQPTAGATGTVETTGGVATGSPPTGGTGKGRSLEGLVTLSGVVLFALFSFLSSLEMERTTKLLTGVGIVAALAVAILGGLAYAYRKHPQVAGVTNFVVLTLVILLSSLVPIVILGRDARVLGLQLFGILFLSLFPGWLYLQFISAKGKSLWDEEGIEDIQNLATANIVDVVLRTRIPLDRLIDWIDQSHLYLHLWPDAGKDDLEKSADRATLRRHGIRTATDLENVFSKSERHGRKEESAENYRWLLNDKAEPPSITEAIFVALKDEPNLHHVRSWKAYAFARSGEEVEVVKQRVALLRTQSAVAA
ncbi:MAG: hypothetical protein ACRD2T_11110 [Thermoanaerobaculia bacterium]